MGGTVQYEKSLPVRYGVDVCVVGGGPAGIAAAVTAARQGRSVLLIEQTGSFGGASAIAGVPEIMNFDDGEHFLAGGFGREVHDALFGECRYRREWKITPPEALKRYYDSVILSAGVTPLLYAHLCDVVKSGRRITHIVLSAPEGVFAVSASFFIDCTGNGSLCTLAGIPSDFGDENGITMPATLCSLWGGVDFEHKSHDQDQTKEAFEAGVLSQYDTILPGIKANYSAVGVGGGNVGHVFAVDDRSSEKLTDAMIFGRKSVAEYENYYRRYVTGCESATLLRTADYLGIRESRRIRCVTPLSSAHFSDGYVYPDEVGRYSYPIDIHPMTPDVGGMKDFDRSVSIRHKTGESYGIPLGCLVPIDSENLFVAGRCVGADRAMQASVRVIPGCYITGQAVGMAAAVCCEQNTPTDRIRTDEVQARLRSIGAYL